MTVTNEVRERAQQMYERNSVRSSIPYPPWADADEVTRARYYKWAAEAMRDEVAREIQDADVNLRESMQGVLAKTIRLMAKTGHLEAARETVARELALPPDGMQEKAGAEAIDYLFRLAQAELDANEESRHLLDDPLATAVAARDLMRSLVSTLDLHAKLGA